MYSSNTNTEANISDIAMKPMKIKTAVSPSIPSKLKKILLKVGNLLEKMAEIDTL